MEVITKSFEELNKEELYQLLALRAEVFVVEQECAYQDVDGKDLKALHVLGKLGNKLIGYARIFPPGAYFEEASMGRIVIQKDHRSYGLGKEIVLAAQQSVFDYFKTQKIRLSAQSYLQEFYKELGYHSSGEEYLEDGIPHIAMLRH